MAVASDGPYASLHLTPDRHHASTPLLSFYRPDAVPAAQPTASKHQSKEIVLHVLRLAESQLNTSLERFS